MILGILIGCMSFNVLNYLLTVYGDKLPNCINDYVNGGMAPAILHQKFNSDEEELENMAKSEIVSASLDNYYTEK